MKSILTIVLSFLLVVSGLAQTRNVVVNTNGVVVQPTNFWSADVTNARSGLGLGSAATNPASAFQPSSSVLSNLASGNIDVTSLLSVNSNNQVIANVGTNTLRFTNNVSFHGGPFITDDGVFFGTNKSNGISLQNQEIYAGGIAVLSWNTNEVDFGTATITANTRNNLGLGATWLTNTNVTNFRMAIGLGSTNNVTFANIEAIGTLTMFGVSGIAFDDPEAADNTRTNLGLGWPALTNTNAGTGLVSVNTNGEVVSPTNFWQSAPIQTLVQDFTGIATSQTNNATNARNVYIYSFNTNVSGISNTIILPTNTSTFNGDEVTVIHKGTTNVTTVVRQAGSTNNLITLNRLEESVKFIRELGQWDFYHNISFVEPIQFSGTNATANASASRTNLGLGLPALTNTSNTTFQQAIFTTNAAPTNTANVNGIGFNTAIAWMAVNIVTNGVTNTFLIPLFK